MKRILALALLLALPCLAQNSPQYQVNLSFLTGGPYQQSSALDVSFGSQFTTNNMIQADFITMPGPSYTGYFGGNSYNLCGVSAIEALLATTSLSCGKFAPMLEGELGLGRLNPVGGTTVQGAAGLAGIGIGYDPSGMGHFGLLFKGGWGRFGPTVADPASTAGGKLSGNGFYFYSGFNFGGGTNPGATEAKRERMMRAQAKKQAKINKMIEKNKKKG